MTLDVREDVVSLARVSLYRVVVRGFLYAGKRERFDAAAECAADVCGVSYNDLSKALINWLWVVIRFLWHHGSFAISKANLRSNEGCKPMVRAVSSWNGCFAWLCLLTLMPGKGRYGGVRLQFGFSDNVLAPAASVAKRILCFSGDWWLSLCMMF